MTTDVTPLDLSAIRAEIAKRREAEVAEEQAVAQERYRYVRPFSTAADGLIEFVQNPEGRFCLGLRDIDAKTRGFGRGELVYVTGRAHSGKTQVVMNAIANNPQSRIIMFTPDEVSELILSKLVAIRHGINSEEMERLIKAGDQEVIGLVRQTAEKDFRHLIVIDESLTMEQMEEAVREAEHYWGARTDAAIIDFLELIPGGDGDAVGVASKSQALKRWTKHIDAPVICLHQASRSSGDRGKSAGMNAMRYGGECLHPDTLLDMADGTRRRAADIAAGDVVVAWGPHDGPTHRAVAGVWDNGVQPIYTVTTHRGRKVKVTGNHPFLTRRGWVRADELTTEDHVRVALRHTHKDGGSFAYGYFVGWDLVASVEVGEPEPTLAVEVEVDHTFITEGIVTHNTEAIFVLEVFRKREDQDLDAWDRQQHENTVTVSVVKNKRPPCKTGETDLFMDPQTGVIRPLQPSDQIQISDQLGRALTANEGS